MINLEALNQLSVLSEKCGELLRQNGLILATAESCTGGWVAKAITDIAGSSQWFDRGFVTYTNISKTELLDVNPVTLTQYGAVSKEVVSEMALGALRFSQANISVAISGIAGPGGGSQDKPVGTVWFAWAKHGELQNAESLLFAGDRESVRFSAVLHAIQKTYEYSH
ncbi:MAG: nicotinamide-nucleotide amidase [Gammaproteobacteria bacterium]|nr:nicotinamide-nucleotide amidase [Gammaproteobacteria bacterium]